MKNVPIHKLQERAALGLEMGHTSFEGAREALEGLEIHLDDCYSFLLIETDEGSMEVDFINVHLLTGHLHTSDQK
jgi:hypothetical protein